MSDLNRDGLTDIVAACEDSAVSVLIGTVAGAFQQHVDYSVGRKAPHDVSVRRVAVGDLNADGIRDLVVTDAEASTVTTLLGVGDGTFRSREDSPVGLGPYDVVIGDYNEDGWGDVIAANWEGKSLSLLLSSPGFGLLPHRDYILPSAKPVSLASADFNADGHLDLAIATDTFWDGNFLLYGTLSILLGKGDGSFQPRIVLDNDAGGRSIVAADFDSDGILDLVCANTIAVAVEFRRGLGDGHFQDSVMLGVGGASSLAAGDLNGDGHPDVVLNHGNSVTVLLGKGDGTFQPTNEGVLGDYSSAIALGDVNQDGRLDIASTSTSSVVVMLNRWVNPSPHPANAFLLREHRPIPLTGRGADVCFEIEPVEGSYEDVDVDTTTMSLRSLRTGTVSKIYAVQSNGARTGDENHNGVGEISACFAGKDIARLFSRIRGRQRVEAWLAACLGSGGEIRARVELDLIGSPTLPHVTFSPNPLGASGALSVTTSQAGRIAVRLYDVQGRLMGTILDRSVTPGTMSIRVGRNDGVGRQLPSGVYFYKVETPDGTSTGRFAVTR